MLEEARPSVEKDGEERQSARAPQRGNFSERSEYFAAIFGATQPGIFNQVFFVAQINQAINTALSPH